MADPGAMLWTTHRLEDGSYARVRLTRPSDAEQVGALLTEAGPRADDADVRRLTFYDPRERLVVAATAATEGREDIVGVADVELLATGLAQIGIVLLGREAVGALLSEAVASLAFQRGATHLKARCDDEQAVIGLLDRVGPTVKVMEDGTPVLYTRLTGSAA